MVRPDVDALLQGAIDDTLTAQERETLRQLMRDDSAVRDRAAELNQVKHLLSTLGPADAPPDLVAEVLARIDPQTQSAAAQPVVHPFVRRSIPKRGVTVNKKIIFSLAAAAVVALAVITYTSYPPATTGTEATIGAAQRAQAPQIAASDVQLADASAQEFLQSEVFDELVNDENTRTLLEDTSLRESLTDADLKKALEDDEVRAYLRTGAVAKKMLEDQELWRNLDDTNYRRQIQDANLKKALNNEAFVRAIKNSNLRRYLARPGFAEALARDQVRAAMRHRGFDAAARGGTRFSEAMARSVKARAEARPLAARPR